MLLLFISLGFIQGFGFFLRLVRSSQKVCPGKLTGVEWRKREGPKRTPGIQGGLEDSKRSQDGDIGRVLRRGERGRARRGGGRVKGRRKVRKGVRVEERRGEEKEGRVDKGRGGEGGG